MLGLTNHNICYMYICTYIYIYIYTYVHIGVKVVWKVSIERTPSEHGHCGHFPPVFTSPTTQALNSLSSYVQVSKLLWDGETRCAAFLFKLVAEHKSSQVCTSPSTLSTCRQHGGRRSRILPGHGFKRPLVSVRSNLLAERRSRRSGLVCRALEGVSVRRSKIS